jgi:hypothetical protein
VLIAIKDRDVSNGYLFGLVNGKTGWFPEEFVEVLLDPGSVSESEGAVKSVIMARAEQKQNIDEGQKKQPEEDNLIIIMDSKYSIIEFAKQYFNVPTSGSTGTIRSSSTPASVNPGTIKLQKKNSGTLRGMTITEKFGTLTKMATMRMKSNDGPVDDAEAWKELIPRVRYSPVSYCIDNLEHCN